MSAPRLTRLSRAFLAGAVLLITAGLPLFVTQARAETVKGRFVWHNTKWESIDVGDVPGHVVGVVEFKGLVLFENGEIATSSEVATFEFTNGSGKMQGYMLFTFEDGSTQVIKFQGIDTVDQEGKKFVKGKYSYIRGSGRFAGIQGGGTFSGKYFAEAESGYDDLTGTYTLPEK